MSSLQPKQTNDCQRNSQVRGFSIQVWLMPKSDGVSVMASKLQYVDSTVSEPATWLMFLVQK